MGKQRGNKSVTNQKEHKYAVVNEGKKREWSQADVEHYETLFATRTQGKHINPAVGRIVAQRSRSAREALLEGRQLLMGEWAILIEELETAHLDEDEVVSLLQGIDRLVEKYGNDAVIIKEDSDDINRNPFDATLLPLIENLIEQNRSNRLARWHPDTRPVERILEHWTSYSALLSQDLKTSRQKRNETYTRELARQLSFSSNFINTLEQLRQKWHIEKDGDFVAYLMEENSYFLHPFSLMEIMSPRGLYDARFDIDLDTMIFNNFPLLNRTEHFSLIIAALCIGLEPIEVNKFWREIWFVSSYDPDKSLNLSVSTDDGLGKLRLLLVLAYLLKYVMPLLLGRDIDTQKSSSGISAKEMEQLLRDLELQISLPREVTMSIGEAISQYRLLEQSGIDDIPAVLEMLGQLSMNELTQTLKQPEIFVRITTDTYKSLFQNLWPKIEMARVTYWNQRIQKRVPKKIDVWREYERDANLKQIFDLMKQEKQKPTDRLVAQRYKEIYGTALAHTLVDAEEVVKKARQRWQKKIKQVEGKVKQKWSVPQQRSKSK